MRKELGKWLMDIAKYITTAVILTSIFGDVDQKWIIYPVGTVSILVTLMAGLRLVKDDKLLSEQLNNPVNDCEKAKDLLLDEIARWNSLPGEKRTLFASLLRGKKEFEGFLHMVGAKHLNEGIPELIKPLATCMP